MAFALTPFDFDGSVTDDGKVAQLKPYLYTWGVNTDGRTFTKLAPLKSELCSTLELGVSMQANDSSKKQAKFHSPINASPQDIRTLATMLQCIDMSTVDLYGN